MNDTPAAPPPYPAELQHAWQPAGGPELTIRALCPDDLDREVRFIRGLSERTLYERLQYAAREVSSAAAARLLDTDFVDRLAIGALTAGQPGDIVGVARYSRIAGTDRAECAIVVGDGWQGRGLGTELMRCLAVAARARGLRELEGLVLAGNQRLADWARRFGCRTRTEPNSGGMLRVVVDLSQLPA